MEIDIQNELNNKNLEVEKKQKSFLETTLGGIINTGLNLGIKYLLPDFVEDEVINIKDTILNEGFKEGLNTAIDEAVDLGKSAIGIVTGKFDDVSQMQKAVENGGIIDTISKGIDTAINKVTEKGKLNDTISNVIKKGKNLILLLFISLFYHKIFNFKNNFNKFLEKLFDNK